MAGAAIGGAVGGGLGGIFSGLLSKKAARDARSWTAKMMETEYQRTMKDMAKAGLNPLLAGKVGGGSTPMGVMAQTPDLTGATAKGAEAVQNIKNKIVERQRIESERDKNDAHISALGAEEQLAKFKHHQVQAQTALDVQQFQIRNRGKTQAQWNDEVNKGPWGGLIMGIERGFGTIGHAIGKSKGK